MKKKHQKYKHWRQPVYAHHGTPRSKVVEELYGGLRKIDRSTADLTFGQLQREYRGLILACRCHEKEHPSVCRKIMICCYERLACRCETNSDEQRCYVEDLLAVCRKASVGYEDNPFASWNWKLADVLTWRARIFTALGQYAMAKRDLKEAGLIYSHLECELSAYHFNDFIPGSERARIVDAFWHGPGLRQSLLVGMDYAWLTAFMGERTLAGYYADRTIEWNGKCPICEKRVVEDMEFLKSLANNLQHRVTPADRPERPWASWNIIKR